MYDEDAVYRILLEKAYDSVGIYPKSIKGKYEKRNDYQNGWNDALIEISDNVSAFSEFINNLSLNDRTSLLYLLEDDSFHLSHDNKKVNMWVNLNDIFYYAADAEDVDIKDLFVLEKLYSKYNYDGFIAWAAKKRKAEPIKRKINKAVHDDAMAFLNTLEN